MAIIQGVVAVLALVWACVHVGEAQLNRACLNRMDILVVFDASGSVLFNNAYNWKMAKNTTKRHLQSFDIRPGGVHVALMLTSNRVQIIFDFLSPMNKQQVYAAIDALPSPGHNAGTDLASVFETASTQIFSLVHGRRENVPGVLMILTDGFATLRIPETIPMADKLKAENIQIIPIAMSGEMNIPILRNLSSSKVQPIATFDHYYVIQKFLGSQELEICILMDGSGSITFLDYNNWWYAKLFLEYILGALWTDSTQIKVAIIVFNETARLEIKLGELQSIEEIVWKINSLQHYGGSTDISAALKLAKAEVFPDLAARPSIKRLILLITDGVPTLGVGKEQKLASGLKQTGVSIICVMVKGEKQVDFTNLRILSSDLASGNINLKPAVIKVTDYRGLAAMGALVVDTICSIPPDRTVEDDLKVNCYSTCNNGPGGRRLYPGAYHYCPFGLIRHSEECNTYLYCPIDPRLEDVLIVCPRGFAFDDSLKYCVWYSCSCPGNRTRCFRPVK